MNEYQRFIALSRYSRWLPEANRRETWEETVKRLMDYWEGKYPEQVNPVRKELEDAIVNLEVMPSMRTLHTAGPALDRDNVAGYNCSYLAINRQRALDELLYILMCGTGVGFSVERQYINELPEVAEKFYSSDTVIAVADSRIGWATAYRELIAMLYNGKVPKWDVSKVRPAGAPLVTFGGRSSGPDPLVDLFKFSIDTFKNAAGRKLTSIEVHDLCCKIAEVVVVGGVRRSALISLSNLTDQRMAKAKSGEWWNQNVQRALSNNSICFTEKPDVGAFMREWNTIYESKSGERGIFNRTAARRKAAESGRRDPEFDFGCNPCSEIILRDRQFCNLSEVVIRSTDTVADLKRKVRIATILGTLQATLTNFRYLSSAWKKNTEEEALLGVSLTGIMDHPDLSENKYYTQILLQELKDCAIQTNKKWAGYLGINPSASITCVKPSGTVSQLVDSASGIHPRYSPYYLRRVRADKKDPLAQFMEDAGFPCVDDVTKPDSTVVFSFPMKGPEGSVYRDDRSAIEQLELWKTYQDYWCEHKPSITIYVKEHEWPAVGAWVWKHFDDVSGVSFLPHTEHSYRQAPYREITEQEYLEWLDRMPKDVDWSKLGEYETEDRTAGAHTLACSGTSCEIVDLTEE